MRVLARRHLLQLLGGLCAAAGFLSWIGLAWRAFSDLERVTPQNEEGGRLLTWALTGTLLMIVGMVLLHAAAEAAGREEHEKHGPPR